MMPDHADRHGLRRALKLIVAAALVEAGIALIVKLSPALGTFMRPVYVAVALVFGVAIWHSSRRRRGGDRRHSERRHSTSVD